MELKTYGQRLQAICSLQACIKIQAFRLNKTETQNNYYHINYHNVRIVSEKKDVD